MRRVKPCQNLAKRIGTRLLPAWHSLKLTLDCTDICLTFPGPIWLWYMGNMLEIGVMWSKLNILQQRDEWSLVKLWQERLGRGFSLLSRIQQVSHFLWQVIFITQLNRLSTYVQVQKTICYRAGIVYHATCSCFKHFITDQTLAFHYNHDFLIRSISLLFIGRFSLIAVGLKSFALF